MHGETVKLIVTMCHISEESNLHYHRQFNLAHSTCVNCKAH